MRHIVIKIIWNNQNYFVPLLYESERQFSSPFNPLFIMSNEEIMSLELVHYVDLLEGMAAVNGSTPEEVNFDYFVWHGVVSEERFEEAKLALGIRKAVEGYYAGLGHA